MIAGGPPAAQRPPLLLLLTPERPSPDRPDSVERSILCVTLDGGAKPLAIDDRRGDSPLAGYAGLALILRCATLGRDPDPLDFDLCYRSDVPHPSVEGMRAKVKAWDALQRRLQKVGAASGPIRCASDLLSRLLRAAGVRTMLQYRDEDHVREPFADNEYRRHDAQGARWQIERIEHHWRTRYAAPAPPPSAGGVRSAAHA